MLARGLSRACTATAPRAITTSAATATARMQLDPELEAILTQPTLDKTALSNYVRKMTPAVSSLTLTPRFLGAPCVHSSLESELFATLSRFNATQRCEACQ